MGVRLESIYDPRYNTWVDVLTDGPPKKSRNRGVGRGSKKYKKYKGDQCEKCGFVAEHKVQLDVHHKNHDRKDNRLENLETLCANCHRLLHWKEGHG